MKSIKSHTKLLLLSASLLLPVCTAANPDTVHKRAAIITKDGTTIAVGDTTMRKFPHAGSMEPILGYIGYKKGAQKGLERYADKHLKNGYTMHLTIDYPLQESVEAILDQAKEKLQADEILAAVMDSDTGKVLTMASSNRYNPAHITADDIPSLDPKVAEYPYEPSSVIKPLTLAIALDHQLLHPDTFFKIYNGTLKVEDNRTITDDKKFSALSAADIIVHSSNVGISQISWLLTGKEFRDGLQNFGLGSPSGIDLSRDLPGKIKPVELLDDKMHRANTAYGYGMHATFVQLLRAYSAFNNGIAVVPQIIDHFTDSDGKRHILPSNTECQRAISAKTAVQMHDILIEAVKRGAGIKADIPGLEVGGKTGTAKIAQTGKHPKEYHSSFYGFANDNKRNKYTIGVLVIKAKKENAYLASQSAAPVFGEIVETMVGSGYLVQESDLGR